MKMFAVAHFAETTSPFSLWSNIQGVGKKTYIAGRHQNHDYMKGKEKEVLKLN